MIPKGKNSLSNAKQFVTAQGGQIAPLSISEEELNPEAQDDLTVQAEPLESSDMVYPVKFDDSLDSNCSEFRFFEDGRQRTIQIGYLRAEYGTLLTLIPVHFFIVASVILERKQKKMTLWNAPRIRQGIMVARSLVPNQEILKDFEAAGMDIVDTEGSGGGAAADYYEMRRRALRSAKTMRLKVEQDLITEWRTDAANADSFMVVDGTLMNMRDEENVNRCIGVSKSFGSRYFEIAKHNKIMQMKARERSWTFRFHAAEDDARLGVRERASWYLRLRDRKNADPEFGLIRVEISKNYIDQAAEFANKFSRFLLSDSLPTSHPAPRWDKHLYPIRSCETYLSSVMPSISTITASMRG